MEKIKWTLPEYRSKDKNNDWFWALGIIVIAGSITSIIYENYFFAAILVIGGVLMAYFSVKEPELVTYELNNKGLMIKTRLYPYDKIKSFWVREEGQPMLFIESERLFMPVISIEIESLKAADIHQMFLDHEIPEKEMTEHASELIMEFLGF